MAGTATALVFALWFAFYLFVFIPRGLLLWALVSITLIALLLGVIAFTGIHWATMPPSAIEAIDPTSLHVSGEFVEQNLGAQVGADGTVTVRLIGQQYSFNPQLVTVPALT